ncbi:N-6 DNA methylase [Streptomyces fradiae]|uniref:N-6 DNA methylase n=1 Tax=Streptomyces fradiae TaxID=1906 RepID=UPI000A280476|nr:N-6 DNA methylase [Streptomyces fradiae]QEV15690.1 SAM-dependent methyltransferase [Streptomyces fradiae ATCC 10745 = DSM 40063]
MTAAEIARLAGVGRAAVSNWRRRHADFPKPVGGTETSPSFALADVERWLRAQGKLAEVPLCERVWQQAAGHPGGVATALVHAGCALLLVHEQPALWPADGAVARAGAGDGGADGGAEGGGPGGGAEGATGGAADDRLAALLPPVLDRVLTARLGGRRPVATPTAEELAPSVPLLRAAVELAAGSGGAPAAYEFLLGRHLDANPRQFTVTPPGTAALMAAIAAPPGSAAPPAVLDPACGTGALLRAVEAPAALYAQEADPDLAALVALRLALGARTEVHARAGDALRADAHPRLAADAVVCHPPFNERNWGHDELAYDPRWEYGFPARTESELAWVQHALARLRPGGTAVLLMPPAAASRRSGRRIRADLLRRGALRAVVALPAGAAPPYGIPLHLWVLRKPGATAPSPELLVVDTSGCGAGGRDRLDWRAVHSAVLDAWTPFDADGTAPVRPGRSRSVPVIDLLGDDVDLAPARHLPPPAASGGAAELAAAAEGLAAHLRRTVELTPPPGRIRAPQPAAPGAPVAAPGTPPGAPGAAPGVTVGELARTGALRLHAGGAGAHPPAPAPAPGKAPAPGAAPPRVLTEQDVLTGQDPSGVLPETAPGGEAPVLLRAGDVVVPALAGGPVARVVDEAAEGAALGRGLHLLRPDPAALDPWFLAGFLRGTANQRQASSYASTATRVDVRRLQLPRLPLAEQRRYGERFRALAEFEQALRQAGRLGERLVRGLYDGLTDGTLEA